VNASLWFFSQCMSQTKVSPEKNSRAAHGLCDKISYKKEPLLVHWPCQLCKTGILKFKGVINLVGVDRNNVARTS
jgi:hypothetical protein